MSIPSQLRYTEEHEWVTGEGPEVTVGITAYATEQLGDVVYVQLPEVGADVTGGEPCGEVESTKSVSEVYAPVSGEVVARNDAVVDDPGLVNADPYGEGWLIKVRLADPDALDGLLSAEEYADLIEGERG